jgi:prepilin-type N-terminal cleavage/methylation domain-containing protein
MKKGFTLIEVMVVVVIMGVLAAVGVPKLFGVIAKARAAEVPVAAGTYVNLQNAFLHENNGIGGWENIGYGAPGGSEGKTEYFEYSGCINGTIPFENMEPDMPGWQASNRHKLNYCGVGSAWAVVIDPAGEREIEYRRLISSTECEALTINWGSVGKTVEGMCEATGELHVAEKDDDKPDTPQEPQEGSSASEDPSSSPSESNGSSDSNTEQQQGDCEALAASISNDNGNKYGWVCVSECGLFAPPGKARNAGFAADKSQKKKNTGGTCEKTTPENGSGNSGNQGGNNSSASASGANSGNSANSGGEQQGDGEGEGENTENGSEQGAGGGGGGSQSGGGSNNNGSGTMGAVQYPGYNGNGEPHAFNAESDYCDGTVQNGVCEGSYRSNDECTTWSNKKCNKNKWEDEKNQGNCGSCTSWASSN